MSGGSRMRMFYCCALNLQWKALMEANLGFEKKSVGKVVLSMVFLLVLLVPLSCEATISTTSDYVAGSIQKGEVQKNLQSLNKLPVKSIKSVDGDIIDCVNMLHQPAFDHPDLKNHKIQMRPNFITEGSTFEVSNKYSNSRPFTQIWHKGGSCPDGTIPIRRTTKNDISRANTIRKFGKKEQQNFPRPNSTQPPPSNLTAGHEHAVVYVRGDKYYGARATISVWNPKIEQPTEFSISQIWVLAGSIENKDLNSAEAGWQVSPQNYGDNETRLFTYWTRDAYTSTGCYNHDCPGFIQTSHTIALGGALAKHSIYGSSQYVMDTMIWKDPITGNWWLRCGTYNVGYWPASLIPNLKDSASMIEWGGEVINNGFDGHHTSTQMGSGHFPNEGYGKAGLFTNIQIIDGTNKLRDPTKLTTLATKENCYSVQTGSSKQWGNYFYYGGPGRNPNCP